MTPPAELNGPGRRSPVDVLRERAEFLRYVLAGGCNTIFAFTIFIALQAVLQGRGSYMLALVLTHVVSVLEAFIVARLFVFRVRGGFFLGLLRFWSVHVSAFAANLVALPVLVEVLHLPVVPAQALFVGASAVLTYALHRSYSFRRRRPAAAAAPAGSPGPLAVPLPEPANGTGPPAREDNETQR